MAEKIILIPNLALLIAKDALAAVAGKARVNEGEYRIRQIAEKPDSSWYSHFAAQVEFTDGTIGVLRKHDDTGYFDAGGGIIFRVAFIRDDQLVAAVKSSGANYLAITDSRPENISEMQRRLLSLSLTGIVCQELLHSAVGEETLKGLGTIAHFAGEYLPLTARPCNMRIGLLNPADLTDRLDPSHSNVFSIEYK
jgi:hypothetical protein